MRVKKLECATFGAYQCECTLGGPSDVRYFLNTHWIIPRRTRHLLDQCARTNGRTLGLPDVHRSDKELVADFHYK
jgi:hypothetical protein